MTTEPVLSIVIPTHNRGEILRECLHRLERQTAKERIEAVVVSDGDYDEETLSLTRSAFDIPVTFLSIPKSQQGTARNRGVHRARGELTLFIGDDIFLEPNACDVHLQLHATAPHTEGGLAVLGHVTWDPSLDITPVMRWLEESGWQFGYPHLKKYEHGIVPKEIQHRFTYASHISLPTAIARKLPFVEGLTSYGWEDIEWGFRLRDAGIPLLYAPDVTALHHHAMTLDRSLQRMETLGASALTFDRLNQQLHVLPSGWKRWAYRLISLSPTMRGHHAAAFLRGMRPRNDRSKLTPRQPNGGSVT